MTAAARNWASRLFLWLALAAVLVPALGSTGSPLRPGQGSAFSAFTSNVSLGPARAAPVEKQRRDQTAPGADGAIVEASASPIVSPPAPARLAADGVETSVPPARRLSGAIGPRAPPPSATL